MSRNERHCNPYLWAKSIASAGEREISSEMALTRERSRRRVAAGTETAAPSVAARNERRFIGDPQTIEIIPRLSHQIRVKIFCGETFMKAALKVFSRSGIIALICLTLAAQAPYKSSIVPSDVAIELPANTGAAALWQSLKK